jgi:biotin operon repressor
MESRARYTKGGAGMNAAAVLNALLLHTGSRSGVRANVLARQLDCSAREVRKYVSELREQGTPICGRPATGYYIAETAQELEDTCAFLRGRAMHSLTLEARLRKITLPDLLGQLHLKT